MDKMEMIVIGGFILVAIALAVLFTKHQKIAAYLKQESVQKQIKALCIAAETAIVGTKKGQDRLDWVCAELYLKLPEQLKTFITEAMIKKAIVSVFTRIAVKLEDGTTVAMA